MEIFGHLWFEGVETKELLSVRSWSGGHDTGEVERGQGRAGPQQPGPDGGAPQVHHYHRGRGPGGGRGAGTDEGGAVVLPGVEGQGLGETHLTAFYCVNNFYNHQSLAAVNTYSAHIHLA